ncbi:hypothetical protein [Kistimonas asteriae]|uniref:hypothetical protein n=1 Tax=Kistimonas asteriae TaxID=517724 RepID=UPI001BA6CB09|nr:hypothetical protein [Kistimonas asteriae]
MDRAKGSSSSPQLPDNGSVSSERSTDKQATQLSPWKQWNLKKTNSAQAKLVRHPPNNLPQENDKQREVKLTASVQKTAPTTRINQNELKTGNNATASQEITYKEINPDNPIYQMINNYLQCSAREPVSEPLLKSEGMMSLRDKKRALQLDILNITEVENLALEEQYNQHKKIIRSAFNDNAHPLEKIKPTTYLLTTGLEESIGELYLLHGTSETVMGKIIQEGFKPEISAMTNMLKGYGMLGQGTYFTDSLKKAMIYIPPGDSQPDLPHTKTFKILVAKVILGHPKKRRGILHPGNLRRDNHQTIKENRHSVFSQGLDIDPNPFSGAGPSNEFLLKKAEAMCPKFIVTIRLKR